MVTVGTLGSILKRKYSAKNKPGLEIHEKKDLLKDAQYDCDPATDSEIDAMYGKGSATKAMDEAYDKMKKMK